MNIHDDLNNLICQRKSIGGDIDYSTNPVILSIIQLVTQDVAATINFLDNECSEEQLVWLSEVFDEIAVRTQSKELLAALRRGCEKYPETTRKYNLLYFVESAAEFIDQSGKQPT